MQLPETGMTAVCNIGVPEKAESCCRPSHWDCGIISVT